MVGSAMLAKDPSSTDMATATPTQSKARRRRSGGRPSGGSGSFIGELVLRHTRPGKLDCESAAGKGVSGPRCGSGYRTGWQYQLVPLPWQSRLILSTFRVEPERPGRVQRAHHERDSE